MIKTVMSFSVVLAIMLTTIAPAGAHQKHRTVPQLTRVLKAKERAYKHHHQIVVEYLAEQKRWRIALMNTQPRFLTAAYEISYCPALGIRTPRNICFHAKKQEVLLREINRTRHKIRRLLSYNRPAPLPPIGHLALWECIHGGEGAWNDDTGNGYYGGLQMTSGWYGGYGHHANWDSPQAQMAAAEAGYVASGYSTYWLEGQWPNTSPPCLQYASGV